MSAAPLTSKPFTSETATNFPLLSETSKNILFAIATIAAIGTLLTGVLAAYKIAFFGMISNPLALGLSCGGICLLLIAILARSLSCSRKPLEESSVENPKMPPQSIEMYEAQTFPELLPTYAEEKYSFQPTWPPLIALQSERDLDTSWIPKETSDFLEAVKSQLPPPLKVPERMQKRAQEAFVTKMKGIYLGFLKGKVEFSVESHPVTITSEKQAPLNHIQLVRAFILAQVKAFNDIHPSAAISDDSLFKEFAQDEMTFLAQHREGYMRKMKDDLKVLLADGTGYKHEEEILAYFGYEIATYNQHIESCCQSFEALPYAYMNPACSLKKMTAEFRVKAWREATRMFGSIDNLQNIDRKIETLGKIGRMLPGLNEPKNEEIQKFEREITHHLLTMCKGGFNYQFFADQQNDQIRKVQVLSAIEQIALKLGIITPQLEIENDTSNDAILAAALAAGAN